jgi:hypothetical protein
MQRLVPARQGQQSPTRAPAAWGWVMPDQSGRCPRVLGFPRVTADMAGDGCSGSGQKEGVGMLAVSATRVCR